VPFIFPGFSGVSTEVVKVGKVIGDLPKQKTLEALPVVRSSELCEEG